MGIALYPQDGEVYDDIYNRADQALYVAKNQWTKTISFLCFLIFMKSR